MGCGASSAVAAADVAPARDGPAAAPPAANENSARGASPVPAAVDETPAAAREAAATPPPNAFEQSRAAMVDIMEILMDASVGLNSVIFTITQKAPLLINAKACTVYLVDQKRKELWSVATDSGLEFRIPMSAGIAGSVGSTGKTVSIPDCYADTRWATAERAILL